MKHYFSGPFFYAATWSSDTGLSEPFVISFQTRHVYCLYLDCCSYSDGHELFCV